jgi:long-chain acyl-CoA synthetase
MLITLSLSNVNNRHYIENFASMNVPLEPSEEVETINNLLLDRVNSSPNQTALFHSINDHWNKVSWKEYSDRIDAIGRALLNLGLKQGDKVAIIGRNTLDWFISDMGVMTAGLVSVPIYETSSSDQIRYILQHSNTKVIFAENSSYLERILPIVEETPSLETIVVQTNEVEESSLIKSKSSFLTNNDQIDKELLNSARALIAPDSVATFIYTSGTTGQPKAVMLTHANTVTAAKNVYLYLEPEWKDSERLSCCYLPLSHVAERVVSLFTPLLDGRKVYIVSDMARIMDIAKQVHPTFWIAVPRVWEKIFESVRDHTKRLPKFKRKIFHWAISTGSRFNKFLQDGSAIPQGLKLQHNLAKHLVINPLLVSLGLDRVVISITGGAPSRPEINGFFSSIGLWLLEVYGQTENYGTTSLATNSQYKPDSCGRPFPLVELRIAEDGEILVRGNNVSPGYFKEPELTDQTFKDGWLYSGDLGQLDKEGHLRITGRKKDIIITSGGKNITPTKIENYLCESELVEYAIVVGDGKKYLTAIININKEKAESLFSNFSKQNTHKIKELIDEHINQVNNKLSRVEQIKKYRIIFDEFTSDNGLLTNTMKLKRHSVLKHYENEIIDMYKE